MSPRDTAALRPSATSATAALAPVFAPATTVRDRAATRLMVVDRTSGARADTTLDALSEHLAPGDLLVVNDAATLPAALTVHLAGHAPPLELRLAEPPDREGRAHAVLMGPGSWRERTEHRAPPPPVAPGARLGWAGGLVVRVLGHSPISPRLLRVAFQDARTGAAADRAALDAALYRAARPIQYAHLAGELPLWAVQSAFAARPWAVEPASAGLGLSWSTLLSLRARGVEVASLTHAAGLSATGDPAIDAALPLPERSDIPACTVEAIARARGRVIAVGTTVVRALEGRAAHGALTAGEGTTDLRLGPGAPLRVVQGVLTGMHAPTESHYQLLRALVAEDSLDTALGAAARAGYLAHELGDTMLIV